MRIPIERYAPPGVNARQEIQRILYGLIGAAMTSLWFLLSYCGSRAKLYTTAPSGVRELKAGAMMPIFRDLFSWSFAGFWIFLLAMAAVAAGHVAYHYQGGSRPVYLMLRLPDRREYWRRCLALPVLSALTALLAMLVILGLDLSIYLFFTPAQCLPEPWF